MDPGQVTGASLADLLEVLGSGPKSLVLSRDLAPLVSAVAPFSVLQSHGVAQIHWLAADLAPLEGSVVYMVRTDPEPLNLAAQHARSSPKARRKIVVVPSQSALAEYTLESTEIRGDVQLAAWDVGFVGSGAGANLSLFLDQQDPGLVSKTAFALASMQRRYGAFGRVSGFGPRAQRVHELMMDQMGEIQTAATGYEYHFGSTFVGSHVDHLILVDRQVDQVTPLLTQLTYSGLIADQFGISSGSTTLQGQKLSLQDQLFSEIADLNFGSVGTQLNASARQLQAEVDATHSASSVSEIRDYVSTKLGHHQSLKQNLKTHTGITESLMDHVKSPQFTGSLALEQDLLANQLSTWTAVKRLQELVYNGCSATTALRLACLVCLCRNGIKEKYLHMLYDDLVRTYGHQYLATIQRLEQQGLLGTKMPLPMPKLKPDDGPLGEPYAGHVPTSTRLVQSLLSGTRNADFDAVQTSDNAREAKLRRILLRNTPGREHPVVLVVFVGPVMYSEAASVRLLEAELKHEFSVVVAAASVGRAHM